MGYLALPSRKAARQGFTLIELLVVIAIIAILAAIIIPAVMAVQGQAQKAKDLEQVRGMGNGMTLYYKKYAYFPSIVDMSAPGTTTITIARAEPAVGISLKLLMGGGFVEDAKVFFSPRDASPTTTTLQKMQKDLNYKTDATWASTYAYDPGHNPNHGDIPFFGNRKGMLVTLGNDTAHVLTAEQVAKEIDYDTGSSTWHISNHAVGGTAQIDDDIYKDDTGGTALGWRDSFLAEPAVTAIP